MAGVALAVVWWAAPAQAVLDVDGLWRGRFVCRGLTNGVTQTMRIDDSTLAVRQNGASVTLFMSDLRGNIDFAGSVQESSRGIGVGRLTAVACPTSPSATIYNEVLSAEIKIFPVAGNPAGARLKAVSAWNTGSVVGGVCKFKYERVNTFPAFAPGCS